MPFGPLFLFLHFFLGDKLHEPRQSAFFFLSLLWAAACSVKAGKKGRARKKRGQRAGGLGTLSSRRKRRPLHHVKSVRRVAQDLGTTPHIVDYGSPRLARDKNVPKTSIGGAAQKVPCGIRYVQDRVAYHAARPPIHFRIHFLSFPLSRPPPFFSSQLLGRRPLLFFSLLLCASDAAGLCARKKRGCERTARRPSRLAIGGSEKRRVEKKRRRKKKKKTRKESLGRRYRTKGCISFFFYFFLSEHHPKEGARKVSCCNDGVPILGGKKGEILNGNCAGVGGRNTVGGAPEYRKGTKEV